MHCNLKPPDVVPVVLRFNYTRPTMHQRIKFQHNLAMCISYLWSGKFSEYFGNRWAFVSVLIKFAQLHCACTETAISEIQENVLTSTPISQKRAIIWRSDDVLDVFYLFHCTDRKSAIVCLFDPMILCHMLRSCSIGTIFTKFEVGQPIYDSDLYNVFTALHGMQTRSCDENSVRPSVCLSDACIVTKRQKDMFRFLYDTKDNLS